MKTCRQCEHWERHPWSGGGCEKYNFHIGSLYSEELDQAEDCISYKVADVLSFDEGSGMMRKG